MTAQRPPSAVIANHAGITTGIKAVINAVRVVAMQDVILRTSSNSNSNPCCLMGPQNKSSANPVDCYLFCSCKPLFIKDLRPK